MKLKSVHHIAILTDDYEKSKAFYTDVLGFTVIQETFRADRNSFKLDLALNGAYVIELFSFPEYRERASFPEAKGLRHLAFATEEIETAVEELKAHGTEMQDIRIDELTNKRFCFFYDPNGQPLELYEA